MALSAGRSAIGLMVRTLSSAGTHSLLLDRRRRGHLAILSAILLATVFGYVLLQPRTVRVQADGRELVVETNISKDAALLGGAGIDLQPGDRVTALDGDGGDVLRVERARSVVVLADGMRFEMRTHATTIDQLLDEAGVRVATRDSVLQDGVLVPVNAPVERPELFASLLAYVGDGGGEREVTIDVRRAVPFTVVVEGNETLSTSSRPTVAQALREAGVTVGPGDAVTPDLQASLVADTRIVVRHARAVTVALPDDHLVLYTLADTVGDALAAEGIVVPGDSFIDPPADTRITAGMSVRVVQLSASSDYEREFIESSTVYRSDGSLGPGETRTVQGHDGVRVRQYDVSYVNGEKAGRALVDEYFDPEPMDTVIYYPVQTGREVSAPPPEGTVMRVYATWYNAASAGRAPSDPAYGRTATGVQVTYGVVAVDPTIIPLGTRMFIPGYGYAVAADTGGAVKGYIIDLGYPDGVEVEWRSGWLDIYILS